MTILPPHGPVPPEGPHVVPASTVVIFRNCPNGGSPELLMVQRAKEMRFAGNAAVFPGGRVDPADKELGLKLAPELDPEVSSAKVAGIRETLEETGLMLATHERVDAKIAKEARAMLFEHGTLAPVLDAFNWHLDLDQLTLFSHWCPNWEKAFDTRFFVTNLGTGAVEIEVDATENTRLFWLSASRALQLANEGEIRIIFPTRRNLDRLALFDSFEDARAQIEKHPVSRITPFHEERCGETWMLIPDGHGYPVRGEPLSTAERG